jgi:hypothetical protein
LPTSAIEALAELPSLNTELVAALQSLKELRQLVLYVGRGSLLPQLASISNLESFFVFGYCLGGTIPPLMAAGWTKLTHFVVTPITSALGASDPNGGLCGLTGALPNMLLADGNPSMLDLANNRLGGPLPWGLLSMAKVMYLQHNQFSGSIPGAVGLQRTVANTINLSFNKLQVSWLVYTSTCWSG